jgi:hypothetical protein
MKSIFCKLLPVVGTVTMALVAAGASAQCGLSKSYKPAAFHPQLGSAQMLRAGMFEDDDQGGPSIVGMWHVTFTAHTVNGDPIPSNAYPMIDNALVVWHSDGTEIMNSARPPQDGNFCLGVWQRTGTRSYYLNHIPWLGNDTQNAPSGIGSPTGPTQITESVMLSLDGKSYSGTFTLIAYNLDHTVAISFTGVVSGSRITTSTKATTLF